MSKVVTTNYYKNKQTKNIASLRESVKPPLTNTQPSDRNAEQTKVIIPTILTYIDTIESPRQTKAIVVGILNYINNIGNPELEQAIVAGIQNHSPRNSSQVQAINSIRNYLNPEQNPSRAKAIETAKQFNLSGDYRGAIINMDSILNGAMQTIHNGQPILKAEAKEELLKLFAPLMEVLHKENELAQETRELTYRILQYVEALVEQPRNRNKIDQFFDKLYEASWKVPDTIFSLYQFICKLTAALLASC